MRAFDITILGLSITSSWGNGHATTYRGLVRALAARGHNVLFLERNVPWYASNRDLPEPPFGTTRIYESLEDLTDTYAQVIRESDVVIVGSYVPDGVAVGEWVTKTARGITAFYDIDTPITFSKLGRGEYEYLSPELIPRYDLYLSFTGGPILQRIQQQYGSPLARALYCSVDPDLYRPEPCRPEYDLGYMGTYSDDRQPVLGRLLLAPAAQWPQGRFVVAGPQYPEDIAWPENVQRIYHLSPAEHCRFYNKQKFTLNVTRADMVRSGYAPSVRLFEAGACATPIISDYWKGLDELFTVGREIVVARTSEESLRAVREMPDKERERIGERARKRVLAQHTCDHRAAELEQALLAAQSLQQKPSRPAARVTG